MSATLLEALVFLVLAALVVSYGWVLYRAWSARRALQKADAEQRSAAAPQGLLATAPKQPATVDGQGEENDVH